jgi:hypothetical protein
MYITKGMKNQKQPAAAAPSRGAVVNRGQPTGRD